MSKGTKVILIASAVCFAIGIMFCVIAATQSESISLQNKPWFGIVYNNSFDFKSDFNVKDFDLLEEYDGRELKNVNCDMDVLALSIVQSKDDKCRIYIDDEKKKEGIEYYLEGDTLVLSEEKSARNHWRLFNINLGIKRKLIIQLPKQAYEQLYFDIGAGGLSLSSFEAKEIEVNIDAGFLESSGSLKADNMTLEVGSGYADLESISVKDLFEANVDVGNIEIDKIEADQIKLDCDIGNLECEFADAKTISVDCNLGNIEIELAGSSQEYEIIKHVDLGDIDIEYSKGNHKEYTVSRRLEADCNLGNIDISFE